MEEGHSGNLAAELAQPGRARDVGAEEEAAEHVPARHGGGDGTKGDAWQVGGRGWGARSLLVALHPARALAPTVAPLGALHVELLIAETLC